MGLTWYAPVVTLWRLMALHDRQYYRRRKPTHRRLINGGLVKLAKRSGSSGRRARGRVGR